MRRRFFWAIFGVAAGVILALVVLAIGILNAASRNALRAELRRAGQVVATQIEGRLDQPRVLAALIGGQAVDAVSEELNRLRLASAGSELAVFAIDNGRVIGRPAVRAAGIDFDRLLEQGSLTTQVNRPGGPLIVYAQVVGPSSRGTVGVILARQAPVELDLPRGLTLSVLGIVALVALVIAERLAGNLARRLDSVVSAAQQVSAGNLAARAGVDGDDEIATVGAAFDQMAEGLEASRDRERQFLLAVGHDLRTPLTTIAGYAEALEDGIDDPDEVSRIAAVMGTESARLRRLIEDVMLLARLETAEFTVRPQTVDLAAHIEGVTASFRDRAQAARIELTVSAQPVGMRLIDPDRVSQILTNLVENALRHTPEPGRIEVGLGGTETQITMSVTDSGPGIEPQEISRIFDRFYVARRERTVRPEGSGLGLSIVRRLAELMGGRVEASSTVGEGTTLVVVLPASRV